MNWLFPTVVLPSGRVRTHVCADADEPARQRHPNESRLRKERYARNLEQERAAARKRMAALYERRKAA